MRFIKLTGFTSNLDYPSSDRYINFDLVTEFWSTTAGQYQKDDKGVTVKVPIPCTILIFPAGMNEDVLTTQVTESVEEILEMLK